MLWGSETIGFFSSFPPRHVERCFFLTFVVLVATFMARILVDGLFVLESYQNHLTFQVG